MRKEEFEELSVDGYWFISTKSSNRCCLDWTKTGGTVITSVEEWNELSDYITSEFHEAKLKSTVTGVKVSEGYSFIKKNNYLEYRVINNGKIYRFLSSNEQLSNAYDRNDSGAYKHCVDEYGENFPVVRDNLVDTTFQKINNLNEDDTIYKCLSGRKYKEEYTAIKQCVPQQIAYVNRYFRNQKIDKCYKADVSSAFPSCGCGKLPTLHGYKRLKGMVEPSEEYPFAFYINSHQLAIYNELNTRIDSNNYFNEVNKYSFTGEEETILCKESTYDIKSVFNWIYNKKNSSKGDEKDFWKLVINSIIGKWQKNSSPRLSMLSAVIIARSNHRMIKRAEQLEKEDNIVMYIATDCITWQGQYSNVATYEKKLGNFVYEMENAKFFMKQVGAYQIMTENEYLCKCSYLKSDSIYKTDRTTFGTLPDPKKTSLVIDDKTGKIIEL